MAGYMPTVYQPRGFNLQKKTKDFAKFRMGRSDF